MRKVMIPEGGPGIHSWGEGGGGLRESGSKKLATLVHVVVQ